LTIHKVTGPSSGPFCQPYWPIYDAGGLVLLHCVHIVGLGFRAPAGGTHTVTFATYYLGPVALEMNRIYLSLFVTCDPIAYPVTWQFILDFGWR